jgi:hypothetical protein
MSISKCCGDCGTTEGRIIKSKKHNAYLCRNCYDTRNKYGEPENHELPQKGEIKYDKSGKPICHICGVARGRLMSHVTKKHNMTAYEYKKEFGLILGNGITSEEERKRYIERYLQNEETAKKNLSKGEKTRLSKSYSVEKVISEQELKNRIGNHRKSPKELLVNIETPKRDKLTGKKVLTKEYMEQYIHDYETLDKKTLCEKYNISYNFCRQKCWFYKKKLKELNDVIQE